MQVREDLPPASRTLSIEDLAVDEGCVYQGQAVGFHRRSFEETPDDFMEVVAVRGIASESQLECMVQIFASYAIHFPANTQHGG
jgi:hypothetical protein